MKLSFASIFLVLALFIAGCKGDSSATTDKDSTTTTTAASNADTTKPSDSTTTSASADNTEGANSVVGTWTTDDKEMNDQTAEFKDDGTITVSGTLKEPKDAKVEGTMTYKIDGDKMTEKVTSMKMTAGPDADAATKKQIDDQNAQATPDALAKGPEQSDTIKWLNKDSFTLTSKDGKVTTFTRKT